ncbi:hypothetical protein LQZ18_10725 [Lachnospiraceae bacterium ZAX-1]
MPIIIEIPNIQAWDGSDYATRPNHAIVRILMDDNITMHENILNIMDIDKSVFERALNIIFDILIELYEKRGLAYVESNRDDTDFALEYVNISIEILKWACLPEVTKTILELSYIKIMKEHNLTMEQIFELTIIKYLMPYVQEMDIEYIMAFQSYFCSQDTIMKNYLNIKKYVDS